MALFCTRCGTPAAPEAAFCENCGAPLGKPTVTSSPASAGHASAPAIGIPQLPRLSRKAWSLGLGAVGLMVAVAALAYLLLQPPAPSRDRLLAAVKAAHGDRLTARQRQELCLSNMRYDNQPMNVGQFDSRTQEWLNVLVAAGLYQPGQPIYSGGFFSQTLIQYQPTPELARWLEGARLCVAKSVVLADVIDIGEPEELKLGSGDRAYTTQALNATLVFQAEQTAPWLDTPEVREAVASRLSDWTFDDQHLRKQMKESFALEKGQWATGPELQHRLQRDYRAAQRAEDAPASSKAKGWMSGWGSKLGQLFSFGGHPLKGTWRLDMSDLGGFAPKGLDVRLVFTNSTMEVEGKVVKCSFEVDGQRVIVRPEGESAGMVFVMEDRNTASVDMGLVTMKYLRVE